VAPLATVLTRTRHQLVAALALLLRSRPDHRTDQSPLYDLLAEEKKPFDMVALPQDGRRD
jgi:hypothetical protein